MRRFLLFLLYLTLFAVSCTPQTTPAAAEKLPAPLGTPAAAHAPEIRFALIGAPRNVNVWELFDKTGASYLDYALRFEYWPRLYQIVPPDFSFHPFAAQSLPSDVIWLGEFYSSTVKLRPDLKWTDGSRFTAEDVAFTINNALAFELGFDWGMYYSREYIDHVEAVNAVTVKFIFKQKPSVGVWQYGALQGPIVQKAFWESHLIEAAKGLPQDSLNFQIKNARFVVSTIQWDIDELSAKLAGIKSAGQGSRPLEIEIEHRKRELGFAQNNLDDLLEEYAAKVKATHQFLYALDAKNEPTLGTWVFDSKKSNVWINKTNPNFPFGKPNFDRAVYHFYSNEKDALAAFKNKEVDSILSPGLASPVKATMIISTYSARFLVFNPLKTQFADPVFRAALSCMIDRKSLASESLQNKAAPLNAFILSLQWRDPAVKDPCTGMDKSQRIIHAVTLLQDAGYSWTKKPTTKNAGQKLFVPNDEEFPKIVLSAPSKSADALRYTAAKYIAEQAQYLGIPFSVKEMGVDDVVYAVYSSQKYDAALIGWRLSEYPGYLCEWFGGKNPYLFNSNKFAPACDALAGQSNFEMSRKSVRQIEARLMIELPFIPLYTVTQADVYQNLTYPAPGVLNGWGGVYGAPSHAIPSP